MDTLTTIIIAAAAVVVVVVVAMVVVAIEAVSRIFFTVFNSTSGAKISYYILKKNGTYNTVRKKTKMRVQNMRS